jgi:hypothetical protein
MLCTFVLRQLRSLPCMLSSFRAVLRRRPSAAAHERSEAALAGSAWDVCTRLQGQRGRAAARKPLADPQVDSSTAALPEPAPRCRQCARCQGGAAVPRLHAPLEHSGPSVSVFCVLSPWGGVELGAAWLESQPSACPNGGKQLQWRLASRPRWHPAMWPMMNSWTSRWR